MNIWITMIIGWDMEVSEFVGVPQNHPSHGWPFWHWNLWGLGGPHLRNPHWYLFIVPQDGIDDVLPITDRCPSVLSFVGLPYERADWHGHHFESRLCPGYRVWNKLGWATRRSVAHKGKTVVQGYFKGFKARITPFRNWFELQSNMWESSKGILIAE